MHRARLEPTSSRTAGERFIYYAMAPLLTKHAMTPFLKNNAIGRLYWESREGDKEDRGPVQGGLRCQECWPPAASAGVTAHFSSWDDHRRV